MLPTSVPTGQAAFWVGSNGNVYLAGPNGGNTTYTSPTNISANGFSGLNSGMMGQDVQATQIADPNAPSTNTNTNSTATSAATTAAQQTAAAQAKAQANYDNLLGADTNAVNTNIGSNASGYNQGILDYFNQGSNSVHAQQNAINDSSIQNELARDQGLQGVRDMIGNGIQGGGVMLDNAGAGTSSAGDALARAYGIQGRQQASRVGSQYLQGQHAIASQQDSLNNSVNTYINSDAPAQKQQRVNDIVQSASQALTYLNLVAQQTSNPAQLGDITSRIAQIKDQATTALSGYDNVLAQQRDANAPTSQGANQVTAQDLLTKGTAAAQPFNFTNQAPATLQGTGPSASSLPIFLSPSNKNNLPIPA